jgi:hypothetical protein
MLNRLPTVVGSVVALVLVIAALFFLSDKLDRWARRPRTPASSRGRNDLEKAHGQVPNGA